MESMYSNQIEHPEQYSISEIAKKLKTDVKSGLTIAEVKNDQKIFGFNEIIKNKKKSF